MSQLSKADIHRHWWFNRSQNLDANIRINIIDPQSDSHSGSTSGCIGRIIYGNRFIKKTSPISIRAYYTGRTS
ncbi:hypothetical protein GcM3_077031 [Golovinomyces cichoracearum]|uniref:Uncharacterized protein n=1 Tax=Golovinomyces cichoracearum TaxID=62708 RepID=A0A420IQ43_9PEZI|nr:hypothetical protein GcM3_077031 [Golovinomyces cichoracearum]